MLHQEKERRILRKLHTYKAFRERLDVSSTCCSNCSWIWQLDSYSMKLLTMIWAFTFVLCDVLWFLLVFIPNYFRVSHFYLQDVNNSVFFFFPCHLGHCRNSFVIEYSCCSLWTCLSKKETNGKIIVLLVKEALEALGFSAVCHFCASF